MAGVDNFCWCDPVQSEKTPDGQYKLAQLVRANQALAHYCLAYGVPCVSGKDSMKNDYTGGGTKSPFRRRCSSRSWASFRIAIKP
jgi:phosphoribosylformylglycinamidine (FGAM) synthase-like enzyme